MVDLSKELLAVSLAMVDIEVYTCSVHGLETSLHILGTE